MDEKTNYFQVVSNSNSYGGSWMVIRKSDHRIMTTSSLLQCIKWEDTWEPLLGGKPGSPLSDKFKVIEIGD